MATKRQVWITAGAVAAFAVVAGVVALGLRDADDSDRASASRGTPSAASSAASQDPAEGSAATNGTKSRPSEPGSTARGAEPRPSGSSATAPVPPEAEPVRVGDMARLPGGLQVAIVGSESVAGKAKFAGEVSGPALRLTIQIRNRGRVPLDLAYVAVNAYAGRDRTPAPPITRPGGRPMTGTLEPGKSARGVYLFSLSRAERRNVTVGVDVRPGAATAIFRGDLAD